MKSRLPKAVEFQEWVCEVVLPNLLNIGVHKLDWEAMRKEGKIDRVMFASIADMFGEYCKQKGYSKMENASAIITAAVNKSLGLDIQNNRDDFDYQTLYKLDYIETRLSVIIATEMLKFSSPDVILGKVYNSINKFKNSFNRITPEN